MKNDILPGIGGTVMSVELNKSWFNNLNENKMRKFRVVIGDNSLQAAFGFLIGRSIIRMQDVDFKEELYYDELLKKLNLKVSETVISVFEIRIDPKKVTVDYLPEVEENDGGQATNPDGK